MTTKTNIIARNTIFLYTRSIIVMIISVFTSRIVLSALGIDDYGIYNIVGGFVSMFSLLSSSMINSSQRFLSYELGKTNSCMEKLFSSIFTVHIILAFFLLVVFESFGVWFLNNQLNIPPLRLYAANWVFQFSMLSFCVNILSIPFSATIIAHEKMNIFAYIGIFEVVAKLCIAYAVKYVTYDTLIIYSFLVLFVSLSLFIIYVVTLNRNFSSYKIKLLFDKSVFVQLFSFSGWNFFGTTSAILSSQGINLLSNIYFGVAINAARGITDQINNALNSFVTNFMTAMNPQIIKSFASGDYGYMNKLMIQGSKYAGLLFWTLSAPFFIESEYILDLWLVEVPPYAPIFLKLTILYTLFLALSNTLYTGVLASGKIRKYQLVMSVINVMSFALSYVFFNLSYGPEWGYIAMLITAFICLFVRLALLKQIFSFFSPHEYIMATLLPVFIVLIISFVFEYFISRFISINLIRLFVVLALSLTFIPLLSYIFALEALEKQYVKIKIKKLLHL